jgi:hypothetical protein
MKEFLCKLIRRGTVVPALATKAYRGSSGVAPLILNFGTNVGEGSTSRRGRFIPV